MKKILIVLLLAALISCHKENSTQVKDSTTTNLSAGAQSLVNDPNFVKFYKISQPIFNSLPKPKNKLQELYYDTILYYTEAKTLAPKLGFKDSAALVNYFHQVNILAPKIAKAHPNATLQQYTEAVEQLDNSNSLAADPCDPVVGQFAMNVAQCAALGLVPIVGEVLAGTCMIGALITYNSGMQQCSGGSA